METICILEGPIAVVERQWEKEFYTSLENFEDAFRVKSTGAVLLKCICEHIWKHIRQNSKEKLSKWTKKEIRYVIYDLSPAEEKQNMRHKTCKKGNSFGDSLVLTTIKCS